MAYKAGSKESLDESVKDSGMCHVLSRIGWLAWTRPFNPSLEFCVLGNIYCAAYSSPPPLYRWMPALDLE